MYSMYSSETREWRFGLTTGGVGGVWGGGGGGGGMVGPKRGLLTGTPSANLQTIVKTNTHIYAIISHLAMDKGT